ncbi:MAG: BtpA/SgcQ family protein [Planctomycetes bacterium]|nr:BtpA/SgcQ family protein [Planctomycetota bacterium]
MFRDIFHERKPIIGVLHLAPLPGSPRYANDPEGIRERARIESRMLFDAGVDAVVVENFGDVPFHKDRVPPETIAFLSVIAREVAGLGTVGVNVLRNDAAAGLAVALAAGASFIRVNVHIGAYVTDQGIIEGRAADTLRIRRALGVRAGIFADVAVKHASPLGPRPIAEEARDAVERGLADAVIITGPATGAPPSEEDVLAVRAATRAPVIVGSGVTEETVSRFLAIADGIIVGTALERGGMPGAPLDPDRVARFLRAAGR